MITTDINLDVAFGVADRLGIPLSDQGYEALMNMIKKDEVLLALFYMGPFLNIQYAILISSEKDYLDYKKRHDFKHYGFYAVKRRDLKNTRIQC